MRDLGELKSHIHDIESELLDMKVKPQGEAPRRKITKEGFLRAQTSTTSMESSASGGAGGGDFIYDLISRPVARKSSREGTTVRPVSRPPVRKKSAASSSVSNESEPIVPRKSGAVHMDSVLQMEMYDQKRKLEQEHERRIAVLQKNMEELRHKRICDKETYKDELARYERDLNSLKTANQSLEDSNVRALHDLETAEAHNRDYKAEIEKLHRDMDRLDQRCLKGGQAVIEIEGKLRGEKQAFDAKVLQLESQISDLRESETKLKLREENAQAKLQCLVDEINQHKQTIAAQKTVEEKLVDELARYHKKMEAEVEDYEHLKASYDMRLHELSVELQAERDRLNGTQQELRAAEQRENGLQARMYEKEKDSRELKELRDLHQTVSSERLMLQTQLRALTDECERQKAQLNLATQAQHAAIVRAESAESEVHKLRKKVEALQVQCSKSIVFNAASRIGQELEGLTDAEGVPISKLRAASGGGKPSLPAARPVWWFEGGDTTAAVIRRPTAAFPHSSSVPAGETVIPVSQAPSALIQHDPSGLQILKGQRRNIMRELAKMPPNPAYRTTDENETWDELKEQIKQIEHDIRLLESGY